MLGRNTNGLILDRALNLVPCVQLMHRSSQFRCLSTLVNKVCIPSLFFVFNFDQRIIESQEKRGYLTYKGHTKPIKAYLAHSWTSGIVSRLHSLVLRDVTDEAGGNYFSSGVKNEATERLETTYGSERLGSLLETILIQEGNTASIRCLPDVLESCLRSELLLSIKQVEDILHVARIADGDYRRYALRATYMSLLGCNVELTASIIDYVNAIIESLRLSQVYGEQLEAINIYYVIRKRHPVLIKKLSPRNKYYLEYLGDLSPQVRLNVPYEREIELILDVRQVLDELKVEHFAAISGHVYLPLVISGTNMAIELLSERHLCYGTDKHSPLTLFQKQLLHDMGWRVYYIRQKRWDALNTGNEKQDYLSRLVSYMYMDSQFIERPKWVEPYSGE